MHSSFEEFCEGLKQEENNGSKEGVKLPCFGWIFASNCRIAFIN
jgi:hypothetical protein